MRVIEHNKLKRYLLMMCPLGPVLDSHIFSFNFPFITVLGYLSWVIINLPLKVRKELDCLLLITCIYVFSIYINIVKYGWIDDYLYSIILIIISSLMVLTFIQKRMESYSMIKFFVVSYYTVSLLIYAYRLIVLHSWNIYRVRGGASFYGGNEGHLVLLLFFFLAMEEEKYLDAIVTYLLGIVNSVIFMSKGALVIQIILGVYLLVRYLFLTRFKIKISHIELVLLALGAIIYVLTSTAYGSNILSRFDLYYTRIVSGMSLMELRSSLFLEAWDYITSSADSLLFGCGLGEYRYLNIHHYTNCHNLLFDIWCVSGLFGFGTFIYISVRSLLNVRMKFLYFVTLLYGFFEGNSLFFVGENGLWIWGWNYIMYMVIFYNSFRTSHHII